MEEKLEREKHDHTYSSCMSLFWKKLPSHQQVAGSLAIGSGIGCFALHAFYNFPGYDNLGAMLIILGIVKLHEENVPPFTKVRYEKN